MLLKLVSYLKLPIAEREELCRQRYQASSVTSLLWENSLKQKRTRESEKNEKQDPSNALHDRKM